MKCFAKLRFLLLSTAIMATPVFANVPTTSSTVTPGVWCTNYEAALQYAEKNNLPVLAFWGESGCGYCKTLMNQGIDTEKFRKWQAGRKPVMIWYHGKNVDSPYKKWVRNPASGEWPYVKIYWKKSDGSKVEIYFPGRDGRMPVVGGDKTTSIVSSVSKWITLSTPGQISGGKANLNEQLIASFEKYCSSWTDYAGGYFTIADSQNSRLEAVEGKTTFVNIPLYRSATGAAINILQIGSSQVSVSWAVNEKSKVYKYTLPSGLKAGAVIQLKLFASDGKTLKSSSAINVVKEPANSVANPKWLGESFSFGEWTMDLDAALAKKDSYTLVLASGVLWCPYCKSLESTILNNSKFTDWAKEKKVNLVLLDNPKRSKTDDIANSVVGKTADGAPPTLLRYAEASGVSGAAYLSRKMITIGSATTASTAEWVLERNHDILYKGGKLCAPEGLRTGYPTFILVKSDGTAAGRLLDGCDDQNRKWGLSIDETLARLNELLLLSNSNESASAPSTTTKVLSAEGTVSGQLQVNANRVFYKLSNIPTDKVAFSSSDKNLVLTVYETSSTLSAANKVASGTGLVTVNFTSGANKYLEVSYFNDSLKAYGANTTRQFTITSAVTLLPKEVLGTFKTSTGVMKMEVVKGEKYLLSGFLPNNSFNKDGNLYIAKSTGLIDVTAEKGATVSYQIWHPGSISYKSSSARVMEADGSYVVKVVRTGGVSGKASVSVSVNKGSSGTGRVTVSPSSLVWNDGEASEKTLTIKIAANKIFDIDEEFAIVITPSPESASLVSSGKFTLTVSDTDDPILSKSAYTYRFYKGIEVDEVFKVYNLKENGRVTISREGRLPGGLKFTYNKQTQELRLYGKPSKSGDSSLSVALNERRTDGIAKGIPSSFEISVKDPTDLKPGDEGYNSLLASGKSVDTSVPLYTEYDDKTVLAGMVQVSIKSTGRVSAKYQGAGNYKQSFSGGISGLSDDGIVSIVLLKNSAEMAITIDNDGVTTVIVSGVKNKFGSNVRYKGEQSAGLASDFASYAGYYTVTLPIDESVLDEGKEVLSTGTGYLTIEADNNLFKKTGKVRIKYCLANGATGSISDAYIIPGAYIDEKKVEWAYLPVLKSDAKGNTIGVMLRIKKDAAKTYIDNPQVVLVAENTTGYWLYEDNLTPLQVYGGYFSPSMDFFTCCTNTYETAEFIFSPSDEWLRESEINGKIDNLPEATLIVGNDNQFNLVNENSELKLTMKITKTNFKNGLVTGTIPVLFENDKEVKATFKGVFLPLWNDCGCSDTDTPIIPRPFISGSATFSDKINGKKITRGFSVDFIPIND